MPGLDASRKLTDSGKGVSPPQDAAERPERADYRFRISPRATPPLADAE
jgi:hypothetical protein